MICFSWFHSAHSSVLHCASSLLVSAVFFCPTHIHLHTMLGGPSVIKSLWHLVEVYWIFYQPPTVDTNNGNYSHTYLFIYTTVYGWQGETKLKSAVKQTGWSADNCFLSLHYSWMLGFFSRLRTRRKYAQPKHSVFCIIDRATGGSRRLLSLIWRRLNLAKGCAPPVLGAKILFQILHHIFSFWLAKSPPHFSQSPRQQTRLLSLWMRDEKFKFCRGTLGKYKRILTYLTVFY